MARVILLFAFSWATLLAQKPAEPPKEPPKEEQHAEPAEEDAAALPKVYEFNPIQAQTEINTGKFYFKRGSYKAAAGRFLEATKWNPQLPDAYRLLGEAREKLKEPKAAREAYTKYLELAPTAKDAGDIKKRIANLTNSKS
ncbi:MAG: tetratricopeptide repeat protein [Acidobacteria bacterium]|nr:tetratricopeptide repeat protein [Acidobacteriota bacterium]